MAELDECGLHLGGGRVVGEAHLPDGAAGEVDRRLQAAERDEDQPGIVISALKTKYQLRLPTMSYIGQRSTW